LLFKRNRDFLYSVSILIGTTVGVGVFGIPFSFAKAGFVSGLLSLAIVGALSLAINFIFGEVVLRTKEIHQFTGYAKLYLNNSSRILASFAWFFSIYGALLAYIIVSGNFLFSLFIPWFYNDPFNYSIWFFIFAVLAVLAGLKTVARFELFMVLFFILVVALVFILGIPKIQPQSFYTLFNREFWFLPYGVLLFAYAGFSAIPTQREILKDKAGIMKKAILVGSFIPAILYLIFAVSIVGISGETTSPDVISGLADFFDYRIIFLISLFGILAITSSFLALAYALVETFRLDYGFKRFHAGVLACFVPLILFLIGVRNFIEVISLVGSVAIGIEGITLVTMYKNAKKSGTRKPEYSLNLSLWLLNLIIILFAIGAIYAVLFN
jgi:tyrosine-specific transport protein